MLPSGSGSVIIFSPRFGERATSERLELVGGVAVTACRGGACSARRGWLMNGLDQPHEVVFKPADGLWEGDGLEGDVHAVVWFVALLAAALWVASGGL